MWGGPVSFPCGCGDAHQELHGSPTHGHVLCSAQEPGGPTSNHGDKGVLNSVLKGDRLLISEHTLNPDRGTSNAQPAQGLLLWLPLVPNWVRTVSEVPDQQLDRFSCHG